MSINIEWSNDNQGVVGDTGVRIERYLVKDKGGKKSYRMLLTDDDRTYMHVDPKKYATVPELESAAIEWLVWVGRIEWLQ